MSRIPVIDLIAALASGHEENGEPVYPDQETAEAVAIGMTPPGEFITLHEAHCAMGNDGDCDCNAVNYDAKGTA